MQNFVYVEIYVCQVWHFPVWIDTASLIRRMNEGFLENILACMNRSGLTRSTQIWLMSVDLASARKFTEPGPHICTTLWFHQHDNIQEDRASYFFPKIYDDLYRLDN